jgi:hypothetical protein
MSNWILPVSAPVLFQEAGELYIHVIIRALSKQMLTTYRRVNELYDGTVNMLEQTVTYCSTDSITAYDFTATAKMTQGTSQCYLMACINGPRQCGSPIIIGEDYTEAVVHFTSIEDSDSVKLQVYTECIGNSDDYLEVIIDNLSLVGAA